MRRSRGLLVVVAVMLAGCGCGDDDDDDAAGDAGAEPDTGTDSGGLDAAPDAEADAGLDPRFTELAAAIEDDIELNNATAASVAVWMDEQVIWVGGFGTLEGGGTIDENTLFMIGSDTKKSTALALLQQVEAGATTLETTVGDILPDLDMAIAPEFATATIHDLISHQGGIVDGVEFGVDADDGDLRDFVYCTFARTYYSMAPPGRIWNYSNPNFSVAGFLNEELDGRPWADIVEEDLFAPLGMTRTVARKSEVDDNHADGVGLTSPQDETIEPVPFEDLWESAAVRPAGLVWSTPSDQMRLAVFLVDGDDAVLGDELRTALTSEQVPIYPDIAGGYGYGLFVGQGGRLRDGWYDVPVWSHGGNTLTHTSTFYVLPEQRFGICILSNGLADDFSNSVATAMETLVDLPEPGVEPTPPFDPDALDGLVGSYMDEHNAGEIIVSRDGDSLRIDAPLLDGAHVPYEHAMTHLSTRVWMANIQGTDLDFAFIDGPDGETYFRNRAVVAIRPPPDVRPMHRAPPPDASRLREVLLAARLERIPPLLRPPSPAR